MQENPRHNRRLFNYLNRLLLFSVISADQGEEYKFDRNGFHIQTLDIMTDSVLYNFTMTPKNSLQGVLMKVTGAGGQVLGKCDAWSQMLCALATANYKLLIIYSTL